MDSWNYMAAAPKVKTEQLDDKENKSAADVGEPLSLETAQIEKPAYRRDERRPTELRLTTPTTNIGGPEETMYSRQDHSPYSPHHPLRDYYYQSLFSRLYTYPLPPPPSATAYGPASPLFPVPPSLSMLRFATSPSTMSPSPSPASPLSSPSPYNLQFPNVGHFDFNKSHLL
jgi:hypothetical protein